VLELHSFVNGGNTFSSGTDTIGLMQSIGCESLDREFLSDKLVVAIQSILWAFSIDLWQWLYSWD
jgi:hypothetical protein